MAVREIDAIGAAIAETEKEIFGDAFGKEDLTLDDSGDRTVEEMGEGLEGQHEPDDDDEETEGDESEETEESESDEAEEETGDETKPAPKKGAEEEKPKVAAKQETEREARVPPGRLREAAERARAAEAERDALRAQAQTQGDQVKQLSDTLAQLQRDLAEMRRSPPQVTPAKTAEPAKAETPPDFFEDPNGFIDHRQKPLVSQIEALQQEIRNTNFRTSLEIAHTRHGDTFTKAFEASKTLNPANPDDLETGRRIFNSGNPGEALVAWFKRSETLREVGDDPTKYRERIEAELREKLAKDPEFRKQLIEGARAEANGANNGEQNTITRLPKSVALARGGNSTRDGDALQYDDSDAAVFASAFR